jgi:hypothetical protein
MVFEVVRVLHQMKPSASRSKIFLSIVYLWTGPGPEINNGNGTASRRRQSGPGTVPTKMEGCPGRGQACQQSSQHCLACARRRDRRRGRRQPAGAAHPGRAGRSAWCACTKQRTRKWPWPSSRTCRRERSTPPLTWSPMTSTGGCPRANTHRAMRQKRTFLRWTVMHSHAGCAGARGANADDCRTADNVVGVK